jgi:fructose-1,6-bisphosphatase/inositol monophosphatase family enzyme
MPTPREIINHLLPFMIPAGLYSLQIQRDIEAHPAKEGSTIFHHALSDADLTIQSFIEVVLLSKFPEISFFSEEGEQSLNVKYFSPESDLEVLLDPVDGTRSYIDNRDHFQIIVTIHDRFEIVGVLCYMPRRDRCYIGVKGEGAFVLSTQDMKSGGSGSQVLVQPNDGPVLLFNSPDLEKLLSSEFVVRDLVSCYKDGVSEHDSTDLLDNRACAIVHRTCQAIDGGALAFLAAEAGAVVSHFSGEPMGNFRTSPKRVLQNVIVSADPSIHAKLKRVLSAP